MSMCYLLSLLKGIFNFLSSIHECHGKLFPVILCFAILLYDSMNARRERAWLANVIYRILRN